VSTFYVSVTASKQEQVSLPAAEGEKRAESGRIHVSIISEKH